ncbi:MAG: hypothetical protein ABSE73_21435 [Planctomycetota bacterium]
MVDQTLKGMLVLVAAMLWSLSGNNLRAADGGPQDADTLRKQVEQLRKEVEGRRAPVADSAADRALAAKYGPNAGVTTKTGKLEIRGLVQVWYYGYQHDNRGAFDGANGGAVFDTNTAGDNSSFRIRRTELRFTMEVHENVTAVVRIDPAQEAASFPAFPDNQGNSGLYKVFKTAPNVSPEFEAANVAGMGSAAAVERLQRGMGSVPRQLEFAYVNYHGVVPHHDFQVGQFLPKIGEEGPRSNAELDFAERSMVGLLGGEYEMGLQMHGTWCDDRLQYWLGAFDASGGYFQYERNRADTNSDKDFLAAIMGRPLWKNETWGSLELGYTFEGGVHGKDGTSDPINNPVNGVNSTPTAAMRHAAWGSYYPGGPVKGWWFRGEWQFIQDRPEPGQVVNLAGAGGTDFTLAPGGAATAASSPKAIGIQGYYLTTAYKISDSVFADSAPSWLKPWEFLFRYEELQNVWVVNTMAANPTDDIWAFKTRVYTSGINYYIKGHDAKIQANYCVVRDPHGSRLEDALGMRNVNNDAFVVNFQVAF